MDTVIAILILDGTGRRIVCRYYGADGTAVAQKAHEKHVWERLRDVPQEQLSGEGCFLMLTGGVVAACKRAGDVTYVAEGRCADDLVLLTVLETIYEALQHAMLLPSRPSVASDMYLELGLVLLVLDETVDRGVILELDPQLVAARAPGTKASRAPELPTQVQQLVAQSLAAVGIRPTNK